MSPTSVNTHGTPTTPPNSTIASSAPLKPPASKQSVDYELVQLTDQQVIDFTRVQNSQSWKGALSTQDYVLREHVLGKAQMTADKLLVFMLKSKDDDATPLCSIELLIRPAWKYENIDGSCKRRQVLSGCIGGVYTYEDHRGNGYARIMVDHLVQFAKRNDVLGTDGFVFLYSEIGEYYTKNGFKSFAVDLIKIKIKTTEPAPVDPQVATSKDDHFELVEYHQFQHLMELYAAKLDADITKQVQSDNKSRVALVPNSDIIDWFHLRAKYVTYKLFPPPHSPNIDFTSGSYNEIREQLQHSHPKTFGIKLTTTTTSTESLAGFIIWTIDWSSPTSNKATVIKLVSLHDDTQVLQKLLDHMVAHIAATKIEGQSTSEIVIWESEVCGPVKLYLEERYGAVTGAENGSRSAALMCDVSEDDKLRRGQLVWEENSKLCWF
ncbi:uncharacterized protein LODBEIA_P40020 [Lodderomyces beijingensis]|uniref:N-acetyltransferase domain-containing protein n=1 Tax=Lodderomyces beijingensis TaxID=1775926 RepID=A0ABP0ZNQ1_9ASCO